MKPQKKIKEIKAWAVVDIEDGKITSWFPDVGRQYDIFTNKKDALLQRREWKRAGYKIKVIPVKITPINK